ncbi:hypothetical protein [Salana multivorans]
MRQHLDEIDRSAFVNYSEQPEYLDRDANSVALEVFGRDFRTPGMFFSEGGSDHDVPYLVACEGDGVIMSYNLFDGGPAAARGLYGVVITEEEAERLRIA